MKLQKSRKIVFIADYFVGEVVGGAECNDSVLISFLEAQGYEVEKRESQRVRVSDFVSNDAFYIVGNFIGLSEDVKYTMATAGVEYIIYEHDHKYLKSRDPSKFKNFKAPLNQIINHDFYSNAKAVVVLSEICQEVICKNLNINNVYNIGCSLWGKARLELLERLSYSNKTEMVSIMESSNPTKGTAAAVAFCKKNSWDPRLIPTTKIQEQFLADLAKTHKLVFIPQVLETFCRLAAEAKMLNCTLITKPKMLGFASEACFELQGKELIDEMRRRVDKALKLFEDLVEGKEDTGDGKVTAILNCYKRPQLLKEQIQALRNQSNPPDEIWVWANDDGLEDKRSRASRLRTCGADRVFNNDHNWKFYGRFAAALLVDTEYVAIFDDDTIPAKDWLSNCLETMAVKEGILGGVGCILPGDSYYGHERVGWSAPNKEIVEVDLVGHAWFFKREWLQYLWREKPQTWDNGEDIQFSYLAQKYGNIKTYVPPHDKPEKFSSTKGMEYGIDDVATSNTRNHEVFYKERNDCVKNAVKNGWKIVRSR